MSASGISRWHIRLLTEQGEKLSGGADSPALCGKEVAWDLKVDITLHHLGHCCPVCRQKYIEIHERSITKSY